MKKRIVCWQIVGVIFTGILGIFLHFLFELTNGNIIAAIFSAVNESIWEHMKILFYLMLIYVLGAIAIIFTVLTFAPPQIPLFEDPMTGEYGFKIFTPEK